ncbi:hypothetical protein H4R99_003914 [Coemansia sp. RSA 1722]|nr:hypothetical protein LPJ57_001530 [Coemansia sp. RSA 486]KAJ2598921.1 hypothetical protein H4R99_003914 [Coemansia sp. RSA 1722]KAJ2636791.1 hypothetical protein GGF40_002788 [Coemansia sp. RSA 1286]
MLLALLSKRLLRIPAVATRAQSTGKFLEPNVDPLGSFTSTTNKTPATSSEDPKRSDILWSLAERRALLLVSQATKASSNSDPDWQIIGKTLERDAFHCRFISKFISKQWLEHHPKKTKDHAGLSMEQLEMLKNDDMEVKQLVEQKWDKETVEWLEKLTKSLDVANNVKKTVKKRWGKEDTQVLKDHCVLLRTPLPMDLEKVTMVTGREYKACLERLGWLKKSFLQKQAGPVRPMSKEESDIIEQAAKDRGPFMVRWMDVKDKLDRSFEETISLCMPNRAGSSS